MTHADLVKRAARWLRGTMKCGVVLTEAPGCLSGEIPDAIGWRRHGQQSILVECKTSRADFLADAKKPHRDPFMAAPGRLRYFLIPRQFVEPGECPAGWGLLLAKDGRIVKLKEADDRMDNEEIEVDMLRAEIAVLYSELLKVQMVMRGKSLMPTKSGSRFDAFAPPVEATLFPCQGRPTEDDLAIRET